VRAAVYVPGADDLVVETVTPLAPSERDVVVRVAASGVCHSDQAVIDGKRLGPIMLGHEATGLVEWAGWNGLADGEIRPLAGESVPARAGRRPVAMPRAAGEPCTATLTFT